MIDVSRQGGRTMPASLPSLPRVLIRGAGEHATGTAHRLFRCGLTVVLTELPSPLAIRRTVAFAEAVFTGETEVDGVRARRVESLPCPAETRFVPVLVDPGRAALDRMKPDVLIDARLLKRDIDTRLSDAALVIGLGPGFRAGEHCHVVIETNRGHDLGRLITEGEAEPDTGVPGDIAGRTAERVLRAPSAGVFIGTRRIGDLVKAGDEIGRIGTRPVPACLDGVLRGILFSGLEVRAGTKIGDIDPRGRREHCFTLTDKTRTISGGVLEAILAWQAGRL